MKSFNVTIGGCDDYIGIKSGVFLGFLIMNPLLIYLISLVRLLKQIDNNFSTVALYQLSEMIFLSSHINLTPLPKPPHSSPHHLVLSNLWTYNCTPLG